MYAYASAQISHQIITIAHHYNGTIPFTFLHYHHKTSSIYPLLCLFANMNKYVDIMICVCGCTPMLSRLEKVPQTRVFSNKEMLE